MADSRTWVRRSAIWLCLVGLVIAIGCGKKKADAGAQGETHAGKTDEDPLLHELRALATSCEVNPIPSTLRCNNNEQRQLISDFARDGKSRVRALKTLATALGDADPKLQTVAANVLYLAFRSSLGNNLAPGAVSAADAKALIDAAAAAPRSQAAQTVPATVHAAMLSGQQDALYKMLDARSGDKLQLVAYRYLMTHGRLAAFDKVKQLVQSDDLSVALAALASPVAMRNWSAEEQAQICPWAQGLLDDQRGTVASRAATLLSNCSSQYVDALLQRGEDLLTAGKFAQAQVAPFRDVCSPARRKSPDRVTDAQCDRNRKLLEKLLASPEVDAKTKVLVLSALVYQWPDEAALGLAEKLTKDPDKNLALQAQQTVNRLRVQWNQKLKLAAQGPKGPAK